jgi:hypothetical protein
MLCIDLLSCSSLQCVLLLCSCKVCAACIERKGYCRSLDRLDMNRYTDVCWWLAYHAAVSPLPVVVFLLHAQGLTCQYSQAGTAWSLTDISTDTQMSGMSCLHLVQVMGLMLLSCYLPVVVFLLHAQGLCNMSIQPGEGCNRLQHLLHNKTYSVLANACMMCS